MTDKPQRSILCLFPEQEIPGLEDFRQRHIHHPGKAVPFHITLLYDFALPDQIDEAIYNKLQLVAQKTYAFQFQAKPLSSFPTSNVLYLNPTPLTPIEELASLLYKEFPECKPSSGFPVYHMTIALGYPQEQQAEIIEEYFSTFGKDPLALTAYRLGVCAQYGDEWNHCLSVKLAQKNYATY